MTAIRKILPVLIVALLLLQVTATAFAANTPLPNPDLEPACALDVIFILDESGSIANPGGGAPSAVPSVRAATKAIVSSLQGTGSYMAVVEFSTYAQPAVIGGNTGYQEVDAAFETAFDAYVDNDAANADWTGNNGYNPGSFTNWEDALIKATNIGERVSGTPPLIIFFTDGNPNRYIDGSGNVSNVGGDATALDEAVGQANVLKTNGSHIFVPAFGNVTTANIVKVSGPDVLNPPTVNFLVADYVVSPDPADLAAALGEAFAGLCSPSLSIKKLVDGVEASGWQFSATATISEQGQAADDYEWTSPVDGLAANIGTTQNDTTDNDGNAQWTWTPNTQDVPEPWQSLVSFTETDQPGFLFDSGLCLLKDDDDQTPDVPYPIASLPAGPFTLESNEFLTCEIRNISGTPAIEVTKTADKETITAPSDSVVFTVLVENTGDVPFNLNDLTDDVYGDITTVQGDVTATTCSVSQAIPVNGSYDCSFTATVSGAPGDVHENTVTACDTSLDPDVCDDGTETVDIEGTPVIEVTKTADKETITAPSDSVVFTVLVENTGDVPFNLNDLTDDVYGDITTVQGDVTATTCSVSQAIPVNGSYDCSFTATVSGAPGDVHENTVTACDTSLDPDVCDDGTETVDIEGTPVIEVTKTANKETITAPSDSVTFSVLVENTGDVPVTIDDLTDDVYGDITSVQGDVTATTCSLTQLITVGNSYQCTFTATVSGQPGDVHENTVTACDTSLDPDVCDDGTETVDIEGTPVIEVTKTANKETITAPSDSVTFSVLVENTGDVPVTIDDLTDDVYGDITSVQGDVTATTCSLTQLITVGNSYQCTFTATVSGQPGDVHENTVTACDTSLDPDVCDDGTETVDIEGTPVIEVTKTADPTSVVAPGESVVFKVRIDNNGDVPVNIDDLTDDFYGDITTVQGDVTATTCSVSQAIPVSGFYECEFTANVSGQPGDIHENTVTACDTSFDPEVCDDGTETVDIVGTPDLRVSKQANKTTVTAPGESVIFTVRVDNTGNVPLNIDSLSDSVYGDITNVQGNVTATTCSVPQPIPVAGFYECDFTANVTGQPGDVHENTVTACEGNLCANGTETVDIIGTPALEVTKTADPGVVFAPGGPVLFTVRIDNTGDVPLTIDSLSDNRFGDITTVQGDVTATTCSTPQPIPVSGFYECAFTATVSGQPGDTHTNIVTACEGNLCDDGDADVEIIADGFCPVDPNVNFELTDVVGTGQGSTRKGFRTRKLVVPNYQNVVELYGQLAAVEVGQMRFVRFRYPDKTNVKVSDPTSYGYRGYAVTWWGAELEPAKYIKGQFFWGKNGKTAPRAFVLWPTHSVNEEYANVFELFDESSENHVFWDEANGWIAEQTQTLTIPATQAPGAELTVKVAIVDNNADDRPVVLMVTAGGVTETWWANGPDKKDTLNIVELTLSDLPFRTNEVEITLFSPQPFDGEYSTGEEGGDSAAMIGATANYACADPNN